MPPSLIVQLIPYHNSFVVSVLMTPYLYQYYFQNLLMIDETTVVIIMGAVSMAMIII